jgi:hyaluronan synthase
MVTFYFQTRELLYLSSPRYFWVFFLFVWFVWLAKVWLSRLYRPFRADAAVTGTVVIPVVDEPPLFFRDVVERVVASGIEQVVVVINGVRNAMIEDVCEEFHGDQVDWLWINVPGKRRAVALGLREARGDVVVLVDSDTVWTPGTWPELRKAFADPRVGGVSTQQRIVNPGRAWLTRFADWLEDIRCELSMPAMSVAGQVGCLPGRTIAFRRDVLIDAMPRFLNETFLGVHMEVSDDRALTNFTLQAGYRTVYQSTSVVYTDAPTGLRQFIKQQYRWAKGSQYNTLRMFPWMLRHTPFLCLCFAADIIIPFFLVGVVVTGLVNWLSGRPTLTGEVHGPLLWAGMVAGALLGMALRQFRHLRKQPSDLLFLPVFLTMLVVVMTPIRLYGFFRSGYNSGWGTRANAHAGGAERSAMRFVPVGLGLLLLLGSCWGGVFIEQRRRALMLLQLIGSNAVFGAAGGIVLVLAGAVIAGFVRGRAQMPPDSSVRSTSKPQKAWAADDVA